MQFDDDYEDLSFYFTEQLLDQIDAWRKAQRPAIEDLSTAIGKLIDLSQPPSLWEGIDVRVRIVGSTAKKVWKYQRALDTSPEALLMLGLLQEKQREIERIIASYRAAAEGLLMLGLLQENDLEAKGIIASYEDPATPEIGFEEDGEPFDPEECTDEGPFDQ